MKLQVRILKLNKNVKLQLDRPKPVKLKLDKNMGPIEAMELVEAIEPIEEEVGEVEEVGELVGLEVVDLVGEVPQDMSMDAIKTHNVLLSTSERLLQLISHLLLHSHNHVNAPSSFT